MVHKNQANTSGILSNGYEVAFYDVLRSTEDALLLHSFEPRGTSLETSELTQYPQLSDWSGNILELAFPSLAASSVWWVVISVLLAKDQRMVTLDSRFWCRGRWTRRCLALLNMMVVLVLVREDTVPSVGLRSGGYRRLRHTYTDSIRSYRVYLKLQGGAQSWWPGVSGLECSAYGSVLCQAWEKSCNSSQTCKVDWWLLYIGDHFSGVMWLVFIKPARSLGIRLRVGSWQL